MDRIQRNYWSHQSQQPPMFNTLQWRYHIRLQRHRLLRAPIHSSPYGPTFGSKMVYAVRKIFRFLPLQISSEKFSFLELKVKFLRIESVSHQACRDDREGSTRCPAKSSGVCLSFPWTETLATPLSIRPSYIAI